jgi:hypothetical protein
MHWLPANRKSCSTGTAFFEEECYAFVCFIKNENIKIQYSEKRVTGILTVFNATNPAVSNYGKQEPEEDLGVDTFEFWCPQRRPEGRNLAFTLAEPIRLFEQKISEMVFTALFPVRMPGLRLIAIKTLKLRWNGTI